MMNKKEILEKSKNDKPDEGFLFVLNSGNEYGIKTFLIIMIAMIIFTFVTWRIVDSCLLVTVLWCFLSGHFMGQNKAAHNEKRGLVFVSCMITLICFVSYIRLAFFS